jgi:phosphatidylserine/phosphatidylglycerophosphate/cardiolipin synthase-like enzyme
VIVLDPFGDKPVVMTGSHNMGPKASGKNDDNLIVLRGFPKLAQMYAINIMATYHQYRWRAIAQAQTQDATRWLGLQDNDQWQDRYLRDGPQKRELDFWLA